MSLFDEIRAAISKSRKSPGQAAIEIIDEMAWENAQDYQAVEGLDDFWTAIETGYWPK